MTALTETAPQAKPSGLGPYATFISRHAAVVPTFAAILILLAMQIGGELYFGRFVQPRTLSALLLDNAVLMVLAVGMTFVILTGGIDLSVGAVMAFTGMVGSTMLAGGISPFVAVPFMLVAGALVGLLIGVLIQVFDVQPFIASLVGMFAARGAAFMIDLNSVKVETESVLWLQTYRIKMGDFYITPTGILALLVVLVAFLVLQFTRFGRTVYAIGGAEQSARLMGLHVARTKVLVYVISGLCGGIAGLIMTAYQGAGYPLNGVGMELDTIAAVVIGGTILTGGRGYVLGSMIGVFVFGTIKSIISFMGAEQAWMRIIVGSLLLLFIVVQRLIVARSTQRRD